MDKVPSPEKLKTRKVAKAKVKKAKSPFNTKALLRVSRRGEIFRENDKVYLKIHTAKYQKLLAEVTTHKGAMVLFINDRRPEGNGYRFNAFLIENTRCQNVLFMKEGEFFLIPVDRIRTSGMYTKSDPNKPIDQQLYFPYTAMRMYGLKEEDKL